jgi:acyl transferase domain-containing protein
MSADIAVIGMAGRFPGARNIEEFWSNLAEGRETITFFSDRELLDAGIGREDIKNPRYVKAKGILEDIDLFDAAFFGYPPREAAQMDPQIRLLHHCAWEALEDAGCVPRIRGGSVGVFVGAQDNSEWLRRLHAVSPPNPDDFESFLLNNRDYIATKLSFKLDLKGPSFTVLTACSTSLVAIHLACRALLDGECDTALAGGVSLILPWKSGYLYQEGLMMSADGHCRAFDARADGTVFGDGVGLVVLKSLEKAMADRDHIRAVIKGSAVNNDGNHKSGFTAPSADGQARVIKAAQGAAGIEPNSIGYIEAHATGTRLGDPVEFEALKRAFRDSPAGSCGLGSVKTNIGHVNIAAGVSSFIKTVLAIEHRLIPPTLHFQSPNPAIELDGTPFHINTTLIPWPSDGRPIRAGVSAFGFGGTNAHVILEEAPPVGPTMEGTRPAHLLVLSAKTASALESATAALAARLQTRPGLSLADVAYTLGLGREAFNFRRFVVGRDAAEAAGRLGRAGMSAVETKAAARVIFMFPGQGAQHLNMGADLYQAEPTFRQWIDRGAEILEPLLQTDIRRIIYPEETNAGEAAELLTRTRFAQPAVSIVSYALANLWMAWGIRPDGLIGHSLGEYLAACLAGVFSYEDLLALVAERGRRMDELPPGAMLACALPEGDILPLLEQGLSLAAVNAPSLCVVSGPRQPLEELRLRLRDRGVPAQYLQTSHAFHSDLVEPYLDSHLRLVEKFPRHEPRIPIMSTVTGDWVQAGEIVDPAYWGRNIRRTVRFSEAIRKLLAGGQGLFLEVGPGRTLSQLARMNATPGQSRSIFNSLPSPQENKPGLDFILGTLGGVWTAGGPVDWESFYKGRPGRRVPLPTYPFEGKRFWIDPPKAEAGTVSRIALLNRKIPDLADWFHIPAWTSSPAPVPKPECGKDESGWIVFMDRLGLGDEIVQRLRKEGRKVIAIHQGKSFHRRKDGGYAIRPAEQGDYDALCAALRTESGIPRRIIHLWNVSAGWSAPKSKAMAERFLDLGFFSLLYLAQGIGRENITDEVRVFVISNDLQEVTGDETIRPEKAPLLGPVKVIPQEYPNVKCCGIDVVLRNRRDVGPLLLDELMAEFHSDIPDLIVAFRGRRRWTQGFERYPLDKNPAAGGPVKKGGVYLITGGLGGIGLVLAEHLARTAKAKLILTGRTVLPPRRAWSRRLEVCSSRDEVGRKIRKIRRLEKLGAEVEIISADAADGDKMSAEVDRVAARWGRIDGIVHAAGLPGQGILQLKQPAEARQVLSPKVQGTLVLDGIIRKHKPEFVILCSSIASILGGIGLGDYCAANAFLDAYAVRARGRSGRTRVIAVNWDMWGEVGMGLKTHMPEELKDWFRQELRNGITSREGVEALRRILGRPGAGHVIVSTRDLGVRFDLWIKREIIKEKERSLKKNAERPKYDRPSLATAFVPPQTPTEEKVAGIWGMLFGVAQVGRHDNFYELGGHSLLATTLLNHLRRDLGASVSIRDVLDHPTVAELGTLIDASARAEAGARKSGNS